MLRFEHLRVGLLDRPQRVPCAKNLGSIFGEGDVDRCLMLVYDGDAIGMLPHHSRSLAPCRLCASLSSRANSASCPKRRSSAR